MTPAAALTAKLDDAWKGDAELVVITDAHSYPGDKVLIGVRRPRHSCVISVAAKQYDGLLLAKLMGFEEAKPDVLAEAAAAKEAVLSTKPRKRATA